MTSTAQAQKSGARTARPDHLGRVTFIAAAAEGTFVHVYVDNTDPARPVTPIPAQVRQAVEPLVRAAG